MKRLLILVIAFLVTTLWGFLLRNACSSEILPISYTFDQTADAGTFPYPDWTEDQLIDGSYGTATWTADLGNGIAYEWVGWQRKTIKPIVNISFDFGLTTQVDAINVGSVQDYLGNVSLADVSIYISTDNIFWNLVDEIIIPDHSVHNNSYHTYMFNNLEINARYVRVTLSQPNLNAKWTFVDEVDFFQDTDNDGDGFSPPEDCNDSDNTVYPDAPELCDDEDNNCDGNIDEGVGSMYYKDQDSDNYGNPYNITQACAPPAGYVPDGTDCNDNDPALNPADIDDDGFSTCAGDCNDADGTVFPGASEIPNNNIDEDCDGSDLVDLSLLDQDVDGFTPAQGDCNDNDPALNPADIDGDGFSTCAGDCDDGDALVRPVAAEVCDGIDNDCNGRIDEGLTSDADGDGHSTPGSCTGTKDDCNDADGTVFPGAPEVPNNTIDEDCDGSDLVDLSLLDQDVDGFTPAQGDCNDNEPVLNPADIDGDGFSTCAGDCDDGDALVSPVAAEVCDGIDNDCNGRIDEGLTSDTDGDGHSTPDSCTGTKDDCNDADGTVFPGAPEQCDGIDNDCDGIIDEGFITVISKNVTVQLDANGNAGITEADVDAGSIGCGAVTLSVSPNSFDCSNVGNNTVTLTVTDANGNASSALTTATVEDNIPPDITIPGNTTVECTGDTSPAANGTATGSDNCGVAITYSDSSVGGCGNTKVIRRTWMATDPSGNSTSADQTITVVDTTAPTATAQLVSLSLKKKKGCFRVDFTATDNCDANPDLVTTLNGYPVTNGQIVELKHKKKFKVKIKGEGSSDDDSRGRRCAVDMKFEGPGFTLNVTATDACGNADVVLVNHVFEDGSSDDDGSGHKKKKKKKKKKQKKNKQK